MVDELHPLFRRHARTGFGLLPIRKSKFSDIFEDLRMAGLRLRLCHCSPDLLAKLDPYGWNSMPVTAVVAAKTA